MSKIPSAGTNPNICSLTFIFIDGQVLLLY